MGIVVFEGLLSSQAPVLAQVREKTIVPPVWHESKKEEKEEEEDSKGWSQGWRFRNQETGKVETRQVAWVLPFTWADRLPHYAPLWIKSVASSAPFIQAYIFYENPDMVLPQLLLPPDSKPPTNVHFINIGKKSISQRLSKVIHLANISNSIKLRGTTRTTASVLPTQDVEFMQRQISRVLDTTPKHLARYKSLFAAAFQDYIGNYTHWAWGDMDLLFGDIANIVNTKDIDNFDIVSFSPGYGWYYTQGQFTILKNNQKVTSSWKHVPGVEMLATGNTKGLWTEENFSQWAMYRSDLFIKILPLHLDGNEGGRHKEDGTVIWDNGRLLAHFTYSYATAASSPSPLPKIPFDQECKYQSTWGKQHMPGPYILERRGSSKNCSWVGVVRQARGYNFTTEEWLLLHYNYPGQGNKIVNALISRSPEDILAMAQSEDRLLWQYDPFNIVPAKPCGTVGGGGHCPLVGTKPITE